MTARRTIAAAKRSKSAAAKVSGKSRCDHRWFLPVLEELERLFPEKTAQNLAVLANRHQRVCETWIARKGAPDGEAMAALQNSRVGDRVWLALTKASAEPWRRRLNRQIEFISDVAEQRRALDQRLAALERGDI